MNNKPPACILCNNSNNISIYKERGYDIVKCLDCRCMFAWPRPTPEDLNNIYSQYIEINTRDSNKLKHKTNVWLNLVNTLNAYLPQKGNLLDVGAGFGDFLITAKEKGWTPYGVEISKESIRFAKENFNLNIFEGTLREAKYPDNFFSAVTFNDVFEHLVDPVSAVEEAARILKTNGLLFIRIPNMKFHLAKFFVFNKLLRDRVKYLPGDTPRYFDTPLHLNYFTLEVLSGLLNTKGFNMICSKNGYPVIYEAEKANLRNKLVLPLYYASELLRKLSFNIIIAGNSLEVFAIKT